MHSNTFRELRRFFGLVLFLTAGLPALLSAADPVALKYQWKQGQELAYRIEIEVDLEDSTEVLSGIEQYRVKEATDHSLTIRCTGSLNSIRNIKHKQGRRLIIPRAPHSNPFAGLTGSMAGVMNPHEILMNRFGEIETIKGSSLLPYLIGHLSQINLIPLSPAGKAEWSEQDKAKISVISSDRMALPFRGPNVEKTLEAKKSTEYVIEGEQGNLVTIKVQHSYRTIAMVEDGPEVELTGSGQIQFDKQQGAVKELKLNYKMVRRSESSTHRIPITITSHQLTAEELAQQQAAQAELRKKHEAEMQKREAAAKFEVPKNLDAELTGILQDLSTTNLLQRKAALKKLSLAKPTKKNPEVARILIGLLESKDITIVKDASEALVVWSTKENIPAMIQLLPEVNILGQENVMQAILQLQTDEGTEAVAGLLSDRSRAHQAGNQLIKYGSDAEDAVLEQLAPEDFLTTVNVMRVLKEIGTEKSLKKIDEVTRTTKNKSFRFQAASTVRAIEARVK
ncbi:MAG: HEAT repeat domain-containing protein [Gimesia chilikensis]|uniref:HEAT repeat domain-containing protein n=1 Tax=Gimesia chilikensis TaxID=2605989 RepID=UPI0037B3B9A9